MNMFCLTKIIIEKTRRLKPLVGKLFSSDLIGVSAFLSGLFFYGQEAEMFWRAVYFNSAAVAYTLGRALSKVNRGKHQSGFFSREFYVNLAAIAYTWKCRKEGLDPNVVWGMLGTVVAFYSLCRGITKKIGVKTQMVFR